MKNKIFISKTLIEDENITDSSLPGKILVVIGVMALYCPVPFA